MRRCGRIRGAVTHVVSNRPQAGGIAIARERGIDTAIVDHTQFASREAFDAELARVVDRGLPDLVVLAGFMRVLTDAFVARYSGRLLNIHPSLLPAYPGLHTHRRALADGVKLHGCTVHFVTPAVDVGPIVAQAAVPVRADDDEATLAARVLEQEHRLLAGGRALVLRGTDRPRRRARPGAGCRDARGRLAVPRARPHVMKMPSVPHDTATLPSGPLAFGAVPAPWWRARCTLLLALALSVAVHAMVSLAPQTMPEPPDATPLTASIKELPPPPAAAAPRPQPPKPRPSPSAPHR